MASISNELSPFCIRHANGKAAFLAHFQTLSPPNLKLVNLVMAILDDEETLTFVQVPPPGLLLIANSIIARRLLLWKHVAQYST